MARKLSKHRLNGKIERLSRGVAIYRTFASPYWLARVWDAKASRYVVRSTKETGKLKAREVADEIAHDLKDPTAQPHRSSASRPTPARRSHVGGSSLKAGSGTRTTSAPRSCSWTTTIGG